MSSSTLPDRLSTKVRSIEAMLDHRGVEIRSMKRAGSLETNQGVDSGDRVPDPLFTLDRLEGEIAPRAVGNIRPNTTGFRYFLDATQKTLPIWRFGLVPIIITYAVTGILERDGNGEGRLLPGSLDSRHTWLIPRNTGNSSADDLIDMLEAVGESVVDPIAGNPRCRDQDHEAFAGQFNRIVDCAYQMAGDHRADIERIALRSWQVNPERQFPDGWMVVDGRLGDDHPQCVGVVKQLLTQHLHSADAEVLFDLEPGHRTTSFRLQNPTHDESTSLARTQWYMRFWNADGFDANHALIRVEAPHQLGIPEDIDTIAAWIYAERLPRATNDPRWPTLLYPIHFLERILKRKLAEMTAGWPS
ncbi:MAG: hypothetical protein WKF81_11665 [Thermomicrobiales bacterium]